MKKIKKWLRKKILDFLQIEFTINIKNIVIGEQADIEKIAVELYKLQSIKGRRQLK